jgi:hypothetical protein
MYPCVMRGRELVNRRGKMEDEDQGQWWSCEAQRQLGCSISPWPFSLPLFPWQWHCRSTYSCRGRHNITCFIYMSTSRYHQVSSRCQNTKSLFITIAVYVLQLTRWMFLMKHIQKHMFVYIKTAKLYTTRMNSHTHVFIYNKSTPSIRIE